MATNFGFFGDFFVLFSSLILCSHLSSAASDDGMPLLPRPADGPARRAGRLRPVPQRVHWLSGRLTAPKSFLVSQICRSTIARAERSPLPPVVLEFVVEFPYVYVSFADNVIMSVNINDISLPSRDKWWYYYVSKVIKGTEGDSGGLKMTCKLELGGDGFGRV